MNQDEGVNDFALVFCISFFNNRYAYNLMSYYLPKKRYPILIFQQNICINMNMMQSCKLQISCSKTKKINNHICKKLGNKVMVIFLGLFSMMLIKRGIHVFFTNKSVLPFWMGQKICKFCLIDISSSPSLRLMHFKHSIHCYVSLPCGCKHEY